MGVSEGSSDTGWLLVVSLKAGELVGNMRTGVSAGRIRTGVGSTNWPKQPVRKSKPILRVIAKYLFEFIGRVYLPHGLLPR
jgi:hypothetical protein